MNKYKIKVSHLFFEVFDVEAENEDQAREKLKTELENDSRTASPQYETTLPPEHWPIITEDQYNEMVKKMEEEISKKEDSSNIITP